MRDRLVELLCNVKCEGEECFGNCPHRIGQKCNKVQRLEMCSVFAIADHLIAEGVIVPPCKVGQTGYYISGIHGTLIKEAKVEEIYYGEGGFAFHMCARYTDFDLLENEVYFTREEAERALAERSEE